MGDFLTHTHPAFSPRPLALESHPLSSAQSNSKRLFLGATS